MSVALAPEEMQDDAAQDVGQPYDLMASISSPNLCDMLDSNKLSRIGEKVCEEFELDQNSRVVAGWVERNESAMKLAMQTKEAKTYPWVNASNVKYPLMITAAIQFNARAYPAIVDGWNVVKGKVLGQPTPEKRERADRIGAHMTWQLLEEMNDWEEDTDQMLLMLPIVGSVFRKTYFDPVKGYNCSELITPDKLVVNYWAKSLDVCPRVTQVCEYYPNEIVEKFRTGLWRKIELGDALDAANDDDAPHTFLEQHRLLDLDGDGYFEPYIVTVHRESEQPVRIVARFDEDGVTATQAGEIVRIVPVQYFTKYGFIPSPDGSFYDVGFGSLLNALNETINTTMNQLMDAGHLANMQGGFIGAGISMKSGMTAFRPGEWKRVETGGAALKDALVPLPAKEPSSVLFNLLGMLIEAARDVTATKDVLTGEQQANTPVGTTLALIEQGLKVFSAIYKRIHRSLKQELALLFRLNRLYLEEQVYFTFQDVEGSVARTDYEEQGVDVIPVSDPTVVSDMQKLGRAQFLMEHFRGDPLIDQKELDRRVLEAASVADVDALFTKQPPPDPKAMVEAARLELEQRRIALEERKFAKTEADSKAKNTEIYSKALIALAGLGKTTTKGPDGEDITVDTGLPPQAAELLTMLHALASEEVDTEVQEATPDAEVQQPGSIPGMEGPPPNEGLPPAPEGPPIAEGPELGLGGDPGAI